MGKHMALTWNSFRDVAVYFTKARTELTLLLNKAYAWSNQLMTHATHFN